LIIGVGVYGHWILLDKGSYMVDPLGCLSCFPFYLLFFFSFLPTSMSYAMDDAYDSGSSLAFSP